MNTTIENFIGIFKGAYSTEYCDRAIAYFEHSDSNGLTLTRQKQNRNVSALEKDDLQFFGHDEGSIAHTSGLISEFNNTFWNVIYPTYTENFAMLKSYAPHASYCYKIQKTSVGQGYHQWHAENQTRAVSGRILTWILYLKDVEEGGETEFLYYPKRIKPEAGTLILWPATFTHTHRGNPPLSNTKYVVTGWVEF